MTYSPSIAKRLAAGVRPFLTMPVIRFIAHLGLCAAYIQGPLTKIFDFDAAIGEMNHFGLQPAALFAVAVIVFELLASTMILAGVLRWLAALGLAAFTLAATFIALRFWELAPGQERFMTTNAFFEHLGLAGAFLLVAWYDLDRRNEAGGERLP
ncbi:DoxX family protein [Ensifer canadensis]